MSNDGFVEWTDIKGSNGGNVEIIRCRKGNTYTFRPLYKPVPFYRYFRWDENKRARSGITASPDNCPVRAKHPDLQPPQLRYFFWVIDRSDETIKILDAPKTLLAPIKNRAQVTGEDPGGSSSGMDFQIKVSQGKQVKYDVTFIKNTPLTDDEKRNFKEIFSSDKDRLLKIAKADTPEELEKKLYGDLKDDNGSTTNTNTNTNSTTNNSNDDDNNNDDDDDGLDLDF